MAARRAAHAPQDATEILTPGCPATGRRRSTGCSGKVIAAVGAEPGGVVWLVPGPSLRTTAVLFAPVHEGDDESDQIV